MKQLITLFLLSLLSLDTTAQIGLPIQQSVLPKNSLVVNYDFSKSSSFVRGGSTVTNIAGTASGNATIVNSPNFMNSLGILSFNGSNQYLVSPNLRTYFKAVNNSIQKSFTMSLWVCPTKSNGVIVSELDSQTPSGGWHATNMEIVNGKIYYRIWNGTAIPSLSTVSLNQWYHLAMVYDGVNLKAYLNGTLQGTQTNARELPSLGQYYTLAASETTNMGSGGGNGGLYCAQFKLFQLSLTDSDILQEYNLRKDEFDYVIHSPSTNSSPIYWGISSAWNSVTGATGSHDVFSAAHYTPWLNSGLGWVAQSQNTSQWITLNYDEPAFIKGIVVQGRANNVEQWVSVAHIETSMTGGEPWTRVLSNKALNVNITEDVYSAFTTPVFAKAVRVLPTNWNSYITMRLGMIVKPNNIITDGLVLRLDPANIKSYQSSGTIFKDLTTNLSDFTLVGTPTYNTNGFFTFNGTNQYASRANTASLKPSTAISIEQWLNADNWNAGTSASYKCALSCTQGGGYSHNIWSGNFYSYIYAGGKYLTPSASVSNFVGWHHFVTTFDGRYAKLYIDGSLANTDDYGSANRTMTYASNSIFLGAEAGASTTPEGYYWQGKIATTAIYNKALSDAEILQNFNNTKVRYNIVQDGLVANLINPPSSGTTWTDASGNGNNATLNGSPTYTSSNGGGYTTSSTSYFSIPYNLPNTFTISVACSLNPSKFWATLWGNESWNAGKGYIAYLLSNSTMNLGSSTGVASISVTGINTVHIWDFVVNGTSYTVYRDGVSVGTGTFTAPSGGLSTTGLYFGARHGNDGSSYTDALPGTYFSMRVYNRALSADEINTNFTVLRGNYGL
jgi:hypothetical protein